MGGPFIPVLLMACLGAGIFLRLVAKEKHRREKHLQFRLDEQLRKLKEEKELQQKAEQASAAVQIENASKEPATA